MLGTQGGTYYVGQSKITEENATVVKELLQADAESANRVVDRVVEVSTAGRAVKQDYGIFVLALAASSPLSRAAAYVALPKVCRTASTLFQFIAYLKGRRGWSRGLRSAVARWYNSRSVDQIGYQMLKYQNRNGFTHKDALRLSHPEPVDDAHGVLYRYATHGDVRNSEAGFPYPSLLVAKTLTAENMDVDTVAKTIRACNLPREAVPTQFLTDAKVWEALLYGEDGKGMPLGALVRNLGNLSKCGLLVPNSDAARYVAGEITNETRLRSARIHPIALLIALKVYGSGHGLRGSGTWAPVGKVLDALSVGFDMAVPNVEPTGKSLVIGLDCSGSMTSEVLGVPGLSALLAGAAMALVNARCEPNARTVLFDTEPQEIKIASDATLERFLHQIASHPLGGGTDLDVPAKWAASMQVNADAVVLYTDNETWAGSRHVDFGLEALRLQSGRQTKMICASATATGTSVGNSKDPNTLQICGFDASVPQVIADFVR
jgi:60 kDa SS-A/Ro ribonucleoprotein